MSGQIGRLLRLMVQGDVEFKTSAVTITGTAAKFTSQLVTTNTRKKIVAYNNSNGSSGECYWGGSDLTSSNGVPIPKGDMMDLGVSSGLDVYFISDAGEIGDLRIVEVA